MKHLTQGLVISGCLLFVLLVIAGCGGSGEAIPMLSKTTLYSSDYVGPYSGTVAINNTSSTRVVTWDANLIGFDGLSRVNGAVFTFTEGNSKTTVNGTIKADGTFTGTGVSMGVPVLVSGTWSVNGGVANLNGTWTDGTDTGTFSGTCDPDAGQEPRKLILPPAYVGTMKFYNNAVTVVTDYYGNISITVPGPTGGPATVTFVGSIMTDGTWNSKATVQGVVIPMNGNWAINNGLLHITGTTPFGNPFDLTVAPTV